MSTRTLTATRDARTTTTPLDAGAGACDHLCVGNYSGYDYQSHIGFTANDWSGIPNADAISSAVLELYTSDAYHVAFSTNTIRVRRVEGFSEGTASHPMSTSNAVTGSTRPTIMSPTYANTFSGGTSQNNKRTVNITDLVKAEFGGNFYITLSADSGVCEFWSTETGYDPKIVVTYTAASVPYAPAVSVQGAVNKIVASTTPVISLTHSDAQSDPPLRFDVQVMACSGDGVTPAWPVADATTGLAAWTYNNTSDLVNPLLWTVGTALTQGQWYAVRARTADLTGDGAWSSPVWLKVHGNITISWVKPSASTQVAPMYYDPGMNSVPKFNPQWTFSCPEGHGLQSGTFYVRDNSTNALLNGAGEAIAAGSTSFRSTYSPTNNLSTKFDLTVTCSGGMSASATQRTAIRARWARAAYKYPTTGATGFMPAVPSYADTTTAKVVWEYGASGGGTEPTNWSASATDVVGAYMHYRATVVPLGNAATPTTPTINSIQLNWSRIVATPYNWTLGTGCMIDTGQFLYGTQCVKITALNGSNRAAYQDVYGLQPGTDYYFSVWVKTNGNVVPYIELSEAGGGAVLANTYGTAVVAGTWTRLAVQWNSSGASSVRVNLVSHSSATTDTLVWFDAAKLEASTVITPWQPGYVGTALALDAGGIIVDGSTAGGGIFRLQAGDYDPGTTPRAVVNLGADGLDFGGSTDPANLFSPSANTLRTDDSLEVGGDLDVEGALAVTGDLTVDGSVSSFLQSGNAQAVLGSGDQYKDVAVTFSPAFAGVPKVVAAVVTTTALYFASVNNITASGCNVRAVHRDGVTVANTININWIATYIA